MENNINKTVCIIQARLNSSRFKNKVLKKINSKSLIVNIVNRIKFSKNIDKVVVASPVNEKKLHNHLIKNNINVFYGDEKNVLQRYFLCAKKNKATHIVRITGDCPLVDPKIIDQLILKIKNSRYDYVSNINPSTFPDGFDVEVFTFECLKKAYLNAKLPYDKEHVTPYIKNNNFFKKYNLKNFINLSNLKLSVDYKKDLVLIKKIYAFFKDKKIFYLQDVIRLYKNKKNQFNLTKMNKKSNFYNIKKGQLLWSKAKKIISGGNMLFSKRPDAYLPELWPAYFKKTNGCKVTDIDNNEYYDVSNMSVGTNTLGYSNKEVDKVVKKIINSGNMSTLNAPEEVYLAEKLLKMHKWADQVRFARTGGEANSIAIRLARASTTKKNIAFCGYHGWHDWYLAANIKSNNLSKHLLNGLNVEGVPKILKKTIFPFMYNDFKTLEKIVKKKNIGIIKMEVVRNEMPKNNFLKKIRNLANKNKIILIFDECTTGFRQSYGGIHKIFGVEPDMMVLGKALGNGYAITSVLGKKNIMNNIKNTFISSTFWTERIGSAAALKTLEVMERTRSWKKITIIGKKIIAEWKKLSQKHKLNIKINGIPALCSFTFKSENHNLYKTFITQEMLKKGFLATNVVYACVSHKENILKKYFKELDIIFGKIKEFENGKNIHNYLEAKQATQSFARLN